jgi:hypothetical protein
LVQWNNTKAPTFSVLAEPETPSNSAKKPFNRRNTMQNMRNIGAILAMAGLLFSFPLTAQARGSGSAEVNSSASAEVNKGPANEGITAQIGGSKCYPDWAAVAKTSSSSSQDCPSSSSNYPDRNTIKKIEPHS